MLLILKETKCEQNFAPPNGELNRTRLLFSTYLFSRSTMRSEILAAALMLARSWWCCYYCS